MIKIIFESHSTSKDNERGIASGHLDCPLSEKGILQAQELGIRYPDIEIVYCSDLIRSRETAKIAFEKRKIKIIEDVRLREWNYGIYNGTKSLEVEHQKCHHITQPFPEGESLVMALERINEFLEKVEENVLIIGHRAVFYALEHRFKKCPLEELVTKSWSWQPGWHYLSNGTL